MTTRNFPRSLRSITIAAAILVTGTADATASSIAPPRPEAEVRVSYADLDLSSAADRRLLKARVRRASGRLCRHAAVSAVETAECRAVMRTTIQPQLALAFARAKTAAR